MPNPIHASANPSMRPSPDSGAYALLFINGVLIALMLALAKLVTGNGVSVIAYAFWQTLGAGCLLACFVGREMRQFVRPALLRYALIAGATGMAIPNAWAFYISGKIGSGFTSTLYALPPLFTLVLSCLLKLEKWNGKRLAGIVIAGAGCIWIVLAQNSHAPSGVIAWYAAGCLIPLSLSFGNVYRTIAWPTNLSPMALATGMMLASASILAIVSVLRDDYLLRGLDRPENSLLVGGQMVLTAITYVGFFALQKRASPVFLSQMGSVAALAGLTIGLFFFSESYSQGVWLGVLCVIAGLLVTNLSFRGIPFMTGKPRVL